MIFFVGLHQPSDAKHFDTVCISVNRIEGRRKPLGCKAWIMDSGAFTELATFGRYRRDASHYAAIVNRFAADPALLAAVAQDFMCEPFILAKTGLSIDAHQRLTVERYDDLRARIDPRVYVMPVLQGYTVADYMRHIAMYGDRLARHAYAYVGVGSLCKRNRNISAIEAVLAPIKRERPDLNLHGFGVKKTALASAMVRRCLFSADSMAWSFHARKNGRSPNDWHEAQAFAREIATMPCVHLLIVSPCRPRSSADRQWPGRFDAHYDGRLLVERTRTPFCDGARALLGQGLADPNDQLVMRHVGVDHDALAAKVGVAAKLTVGESNGPPRFQRYNPDWAARFKGLQDVEGTPPMRQNPEELPHLAPEPERPPAPTSALSGATGPAGS